MRPILRERLMRWFRFGGLTAGLIAGFVVKLTADDSAVVIASTLLGGLVGLIAGFLLSWLAILAFSLAVFMGMGAALGVVVSAALVGLGWLSVSWSTGLFWGAIIGAAALTPVGLLKPLGETLPVVGPGEDGEDIY